MLRGEFRVPQGRHRIPFHARLCAAPAGAGVPYCILTQGLRPGLILFRPSGSDLHQVDFVTAPAVGLSTLTTIHFLQLRLHGVALARHLQFGEDGQRLLQLLLLGFPAALRWKRWALAQRSRVSMISGFSPGSFLCRPYGTRIRYCSYPGLTPWAKFVSPCGLASTLISLQRFVDYLYQRHCHPERAGRRLCDRESKDPYTPKEPSSPMSAFSNHYPLTTIHFLQLRLHRVALARHLQFGEDGQRLLQLLLLGFPAALRWKRWALAQRPRLMISSFSPGSFLFVPPGLRFASCSYPGLTPSAPAPHM